MAEQRIDCPGCQAEMRSIKLIDESYGGHQVLRYTAADAERSFFLRQFPVEGRVAAKMCPSCGRIVLHGEPGQTD